MVCRRVFQAYQSKFLISTRDRRWTHNSFSFGIIRLFSTEPVNSMLTGLFRVRSLRAGGLHGATEMVQYYGWITSLKRLMRLPMVYGLRADTVFRAVIAAMMVMTAAHATAQDEAADRVPSVASRIPRATAEAPRPVAVIDRQDIEMSGITNVRRLLLRRAVFNSFGLYRPLVLGTGRAAVLVNGRRIADSTLDLDTLPISAVERVEILGDSAAVLHGGHAIAGAINIVLRRGYKGVEVQVSGDRPTQRGGDSEHASAVWGGALGRGRLTIGLDHFRRQEIRDADRDYSRAKWTPGGPFSETQGVSVGGNTVFIRTGAASSVARPLGDCRESVYTGVLTNPYGISGTGCGFAYADIAWHWERVERNGLFLNADHPLGDSVDIYFDARAARTNTAFRYAPSVGTFAFTNTLNQRQIVAHRFVGHGNRDWRTELKEYDLTLGLRGRFGDGIGYDAHLRYYRHDALETGDTFVSESAIQKAITDGRYDVENPFSTAPDHRAAIRETGLHLSRDQVTDHKTARASFDGAAFAFRGNDVRWAAGAEVANEDWRDIYDYRDVDNRSYEAGDVLGSAGNSASGQRQRWAAFAEVSVPLLDDWDLTLAGRRDDYDDVGAAFSHQIASRYRLSRNLALRASWSAGARAPSLRALHALETLDYPFICDTSNLVGTLADCDELQVPRASVGNPDLKPDEAESFNLGATASLGSFSLSVDWFQIELSDVPRELSAQAIIDLEAEGKLPPRAQVVRDGGVIARIDSPLYNSGEVDVAGLDFRARAGWETDWVDMTLDANWSRLTRYESRVAGRKDPGDYPRDRVHTSLRATRGRVTANWSVHAVSGYRNVLRTARYKAWVGHDITLRYRYAFGYGGLEFVGGVLNVGDRGPSTDPTAPGLESAALTLDSSLGRTVFLTAKFSFRL